MDGIFNIRILRWYLSWYNNNYNIWNFLSG